MVLSPQEDIATHLWPVSHLCSSSPIYHHQVIRPSRDRDELFVCRCLAYTMLPIAGLIAVIVMLCVIVIMLSSALWLGMRLILSMRRPSAVCMQQAYLPPMHRRMTAAHGPPRRLVQLSELLISSPPVMPRRGRRSRARGHGRGRPARSQPPENPCL